MTVPLWVCIVGVALALEELTGGTLYTALYTMLVALARCSWRGDRWTLACTDWPGSFRRRCTRCRMLEASPDPHGGRTDWVTW